MTLQTEHERVPDGTGFQVDAVFVTDYPKGDQIFFICARMMITKPWQPWILLLPGVGEIIGGSQREEREE